MAIVSVAAGVALSNALNLERLLGLFSSRKGEKKRKLKEWERTIRRTRPIASSGQLDVRSRRSILDRSRYPMRPPPTFPHCHFWPYPRSTRHDPPLLPLALQHPPPLQTLLPPPRYAHRKPPRNSRNLRRIHSLPRRLSTSILRRRPDRMRSAEGLEDGFCGCLSTVSTFAVELRTIKPRRRAVRYAVVSWL